jgi:hypothetical protein
MILWKKSNLSTEILTFTITTSLYTYKLTKTVNSTKCGDNWASDAWTASKKIRIKGKVATVVPAKAGTYAELEL